MASLFARVFDKIQGWLEHLVLMLPNIVGALLIFTIFWLLARLAGAAAGRILGRTSSNQTLAGFVRKLVRVLVLAVGLVIALQVLQLDKAATTFLAGAGIVGIALGFAFQDLSANFIAGVGMAIRRPMQVGDLIETNEVFGTIEKIQLRSTFIRVPEGARVMIPNRKIFEQKLTNFGELGRRRVDIEVGVAYGSDLDRVEKVARAAVSQLDRVPDSEIELYFTGFGDSSIDLVVRFWIRFRRQRDYLATRSAAIMAIKRAFDRHGITIPFPIRTLTLSANSVAPLRDLLGAPRALAEGVRAEGSRPGMWPEREP